MKDKTKTRIFEESKKVSEIESLCKKFVYGDKQWALGMGMVQGMVIRLEEVYNYLKRR